MTTSADLGLPYIASSQNQPEVTHNDALNLIQALLNGATDRGINTPPGSPTSGDIYIIGAAPTGAWAGRANCVTIWTGTAWDFIPGETSAGTPITMGARQEGLEVWVNDENTTYVWDGTAWITMPVADNSVTNAKLADMATQTIKGRTTAGTGDPEDLTASQTRTVLGLATTDSPTFNALTLTNGQIAFPATQVPSADANTLDDYEEGTWTPVLTFATPGNLSVAYNVQVGHYTKIGREVIIRFNIQTSTFTHTTASGNIQITGLPFTSSASASSGSRGALDFGGINKASYTQCVVNVGVGATLLGISASGMGQANSNVAASDCPTGGTMFIIGTMTYMV